MSHRPDQKPHNKAPANRLGHETSPYLLQHAHNPVDWWPWGAPALAEAQRLGKPILLSIGYAACHWCHVMAHESFEDAATAQLMNELYINIKVDREERPDIDQIYMAALHGLGEQGGWPLTMFLTPQGEPFWGGTYFPPTSRYGRPGFADVLREIARLYRDEHGKIIVNRDALMNHLQSTGDVKTTGTQGLSSLSNLHLDNIAQAIARAQDQVHGGLRGAPKFPQTMMLEYLWRAGARTGDESYFEHVDRALTHLCQGGIYDHLGGGFSRYSVDERWLVPHFEKMLYDNAQLLDLLALSNARRPNALFAARIRETVAWLIREMRTEEGGFAASLDADSEGEEGKFYVWALDDVAQVLGSENAARFAAYYGLSSGGNFEGQNILNRLKDLDYDPEADDELSMLRSMLHNERSKRIPPARDDKVLADWNGLMIAALARLASQSVADSDWLYTAQQVYDFIKLHMSDGSRIGHSYRAGKLQKPGLASDYAALCCAAISLHDQSAEAKYLDDAIRWQEALETDYANVDTGRYFLTSSHAGSLIVRPISAHDDATPNHHGLIAQNLARLAVLTGDSQWSQRLDRLLAALTPQAAENAFAHLSLLNALDLKLNAREIVITGQGALAEDMLRMARAQPYATRIVLYAARAEDLPPQHPARSSFVKESPRAYICRGMACSLPIENADDLARALASPNKT